MLESLNGSEFVEGRRLPTCERRCLAEARVFAGDWLSHGPERRHTSARLYARQTARNGAVGPDAQHSRGIAHPTGIETHGDDVLFHLRSAASGTVVQQKTPPRTRRVLAQATLGAAVRCPRLTICSLSQWGHRTAIQVMSPSLLLETVKRRRSVPSVAVHLHF